jgi:hypothetical protein
MLQRTTVSDMSDSSREQEESTLPKRGQSFINTPIVRHPRSAVNVLAGTVAAGRRRQGLDLIHRAGPGGVVVRLFDFT